MDPQISRLRQRSSPYAISCVDISGENVCIGIKANDVSHARMSQLRTQDFITAPRVKHVLCFG
jgi:hypothetical protein